MSETPEARPLLTPERLAEIQQRLPAIPRAQMSLTEQDRADLLAHLDAQREQFRQVLVGMLHRPEILAVLEGEEAGRAAYHNARIYAAAQKIGITL